MRTSLKLLTTIITLLIAGSLSAQNAPNTVTEDHFSVMANLRPYFPYGGGQRIL